MSDIFFSRLKDDLKEDKNAPYQNGLFKKSVVTNILKMFNLSLRSLSHEKIIKFVDDYSKNDKFVNQIHILLAVNSLRSLDCMTAEKEILKFFNNLNYQNYESNQQDVSSGLTHHAIFKRTIKALIIIAYFNLILKDFKRAKNIIESLFQLDYSIVPDGEVYLQWVFILKTHLQVSELDIYGHNSINYFTKHSTIWNVDYAENITDILKIISQFENRLFNRYGIKHDKDLPSTIAYRLLVLSLIVFKFTSVINADKSKKLFIENYKKVMKFICENEKCRLIHKSLQCLMKSYSISNLYLIAPESLKYSDNLNKTGGHCTESRIIENVLNCYEEAYQGDYKNASIKIKEISFNNLNSIVGKGHVETAESLLKFDSEFFNYDYNEKKICKLNDLLKDIYNKCPPEAILRDIVLQLFLDKINVNIMDKIQFLIEKCTVMKLWPIYCIRCHIVLSQIYMYYKSYYKAENQLLIALKLAEKNSYGFVIMIRRRLLQIAFLTKKVAKCCKYLQALKSDSLNYQLPLLEEGMLELNQFLLRFRLISKIPSYMTEPLLLLTYLNRAHRILKKYPIMEKNLLAIRIIYLNYLTETNQTNFEEYEELRENVINDVKYMFNKITIRKALSNSFVNELLKNYGISMYIF